MRVTLTVNGRRRRVEDVWAGESLLFVLRERLGLPGAKNACEQGECGSCTVRMDGDVVCACLVAAGQAEGREVVTVEGLGEYARRRARGRPVAQPAGPARGDGTGPADPTTAEPGATAHGAVRRSDQSACAADPPDGPATEAAGTSPLSPVQQAFLDAGAVQCGFCTPGLLVAADALLEREPHPSEADIREALSGNLCRCTGYERIVEAVRLAATRFAETSSPGPSGDRPAASDNRPPASEGAGT